MNMTSDLVNKMRVRLSLSVWRDRLGKVKMKLRPGISLNKSDSRHELLRRKNLRDDMGEYRRDQEGRDE